MRAQDRLVKRYKREFDILIKKIQEIERRGDNASAERRILDAIKESVSKLDKIAARELAIIARESYLNTVSAGEKQLSQVYASPFGGKNNLAVSMIAQNAVDMLVESNHYFGRHYEDEYRKIGLEAINQKLSRGQTVKQSTANMIKLMHEEGMTCFIDKAGRKWKLDKYSNLVARTTTREATNTATINTSARFKHDLVIFSKHSPTCAACACIQGRVFSISGEDKRFPHLDNVPGFNKGFKTIHPHCAHALTFFIESLCSENELKRHLKNAKLPLTGDPRSQAEVNKYNAAQLVKRKRNDDRREYEKYKEALPNIAPKTFSGYRSMKRFKSDNYLNLKSAYERRI